MNRVQRILLWTGTVLTAVTGLAYAWMRHVMTNDDPFSAFNHPLQPWALDVHVLAAPPLVFALGWFWGNHVLPKLRGNGTGGRRTGLLLLGLIVVMTVSGYLLQTATAGGWRTGAAWVHGVSGTLFAVMLTAHLPRIREAVGRRASRAGRGPRQPGPGRAPGPAAVHGEVGGTPSGRPTARREPCDRTAPVSPSSPSS